MFCFERILSRVFASDDDGGGRETKDVLPKTWEGLVVDPEVLVVAPEVLWTACAVGGLCEIERQREALRGRGDGSGKSVSQAGQIERTETYSMKSSPRFTRDAQGGNEAER